MSVDERKVRQVLRTQLLTVPGLPPDTRRAWENRPFTPPSPDQLWVVDQIIPINERLPATNLVEFQAFYQVDVRIGKGRGTEEAEDLATAVKDAFKPATSLQGTGVNAGINVAIDRSERFGAVPDEAWYFVPVRVTFRTYATNT